MGNLLNRFFFFFFLILFPQLPDGKRESTVPFFIFGAVTGDCTGWWMKGKKRKRNATNKPKE